MKTRLHSGGSLVFCTLLALLAGCGQSDGPVSMPDEPPEIAMGGHDHGHAPLGPHGGAIVELGSEDYHAELVEDEAAGSVTIYILDRAAKKPFPIAAQEITINIKHGDNVEQFKLKAFPKSSDPAGTSSRFTLSDSHLLADLHDAKLMPQLVVDIDGVQYRGQISHNHAHNDGRDHNHAAQNHTGHQHQ